MSSYEWVSRKDIQQGLDGHVLLMTCRYFSIKILGQFTYPLPYDADPALLKNALEEIAPVGEVRVLSHGSFWNNQP